MIYCEVHGSGFNPLKRIKTNKEINKQTNNPQKKPGMYSEDRCGRREVLFTSSGAERCSSTQRVPHGRIFSHIRTSCHMETAVANPIAISPYHSVLTTGQPGTTLTPQR